MDVVLPQAFSLPISWCRLPRATLAALALPFSKKVKHFFGEDAGTSFRTVFESLARAVCMLDAMTSVTMDHFLRLVG